MDADFRQKMSARTLKNPAQSLSDFERSTAMERVPVVDVGELDLSRDPGQSLEQEMAGPAAATKFSSLHKLDPSAGRMRYMGLPEHERGTIGMRAPEPRSVLAGLFDDDGGPVLRGRRPMSSKAFD